MTPVDELMVPAKAHTPLNELIAGLDTVAGLAIPYAHMPRRTVQAFAGEFACWSDISGQTVHSLLSRPAAGVATVRAVLTAARDAVAKQQSVATIEPVGAPAAVQRLLDELDERDRVMVASRLWAQPPLSQVMVAQRLGVTKAWVNRHHPRSMARFAELLADPAHQEVTGLAVELGRRLGPYVPGEVVNAELRRLELDPPSETARVLLHLAGPYVRRDGWFENTTTGGAQQVSVAVDAVFDRDPAPSTESLVHALIVEGMPLDVAVTYIRSRTEWRCFGDDVWVRWGESAASKAEAILHVRGAPATPEEIFAAIEASPTTLKAIREALYADKRFVRASRATWGLRTWGIDAYAGIAEELSARIDAAGGTMKIEDLVEDMLSHFPDVAEGSIRTQLTGSLAFITDGPTVRRRTAADALPPMPPLHSVRGAFRNGDNEIRLAMTVNADVLRGSGQPIHPAVAHALGVSPGQRRLYSTPHGPVPVIWRLSSTNGPSIGSIRAAVKALGADIADTLVLVFRLDDTSLNVLRIDPERSGVARLRQLVGHTVRNPGSALAASLGCRRADVAVVLRERGDDDLAALVDS